MSDYAIFFDYGNRTLRLPVNPEQMETSTVQANEKYEILKLGQIVVPTNMELTEYSFEAEFPRKSQYYTETSEDFRDGDYYLRKFKLWRELFVPIRFIASNGVGDDINSLALIEDLTIIEKAGEEGDKYISFKLLEYREFGKKSVIVKTSKASSEPKNTKKKVVAEKVNPKSTGYHVVQSGNNLWTIAKKYYGDGSKCNIIFNANKDKIKNASSITIGWKLKIPTKNEFSKYSAPLPTAKPKTTSYVSSGEAMAGFPLYYKPGI